ncbi:MAG TPA: MmgE/PrpD family protein [Stellaceae bacterium]|nr:MmgE/PrpD family protein [Stellaceae bacterium]
MRAPRPSQSAHDIPVTALIAERAAALGYADLPEDICALARQCFLDWFAVTLAGAGEELARILASEAGIEGGAPVATLIGHRARAPMQQAALVNGATSHALDYDDVHLSYIGHPTVTLVPALLALGEAKDASGAELIAAFVAGYETICRIGLLMAPGHYALGFHATATMGSFGAAAACARLLRLDPARTAMALGIAGTEAAGLKSMFGTMCKPLHAGKAAQNGLLAAVLAARGFTSRPDVLECAQGFAATHGPDFHPEAALAEPSGGWHLRGNLFKYHAACYLTHAPIECALKIAREPGFAADAVHQVLLRVDRGADKVCNIAAPRTGLEAKFSLRLTTAFALAGIDTASLDAYGAANAADPRLVALRDKVRLEFIDGWPASRAEMRVELVSGRSVEAGHDSGVPAADVAAQGRRIEAKFMSLAAPAIGETQAGALMRKVARLDDVASIAEVTALAAG